MPNIYGIFSQDTATTCGCVSSTNFHRIALGQQRQFFDFHCYFIQSIGMSWYVPFGSMRLIDIGSAFSSTSATASAIELLASSGTLISGGAPSDSCSERAPVILARSNLVSQGGPNSTLLPCGAISFSSYSNSG